MYFVWDLFEINDTYDFLFSSTHLFALLKYFKEIDSEKFTPCPINGLEILSLCIPPFARGFSSIGSLT